MNRRDYLRFASESGNRYVFCSDSCLVFEESSFVKRKRGLNSVLNPPPSGEGVSGNDTTRDRGSLDGSRVKEYLYRYGFTELILEVTTRCNCRCVYCVFSGEYADKRVHGKQQMDEQLAFEAVSSYLAMVKAARFYNPYRKPTIAFYGGEPLLNFELIKACVAHARSTYEGEIAFTVTSNGTVFTDEMLDYLVREGFYVIISLDGPRTVHDKRRVFADGTGTFDTILENLTKLRQKTDVPVFVNCTFDPSTEFEQVVDFFDARPDLCPLNISPVDSRATSYYERFSPDELLSFQHRLAKLNRDFVGRALAGDATRSLLALLCGKTMIALSMRERLSNAQDKLLPYTGACVPGEKLHVTIDGAYLPCEKTRDSFQIGTVSAGLDFDLIAAWISRYHEIVLTKCGACPVRRICPTCYTSFFADGGFQQPLDFCENIIRLLKAELSRLCTISEENPQWLSQFRHQYYEEIKELAVELR